MKQGPQQSDQTEKLQKVLARSGLGSRRGVEEWILAGRVSVNGNVAKIGDRVTPEDEIRVDGKKIATKAPEESVRRVLVYNKPEGEVCTRSDPQGRPTVFSNLPKLKNERWVAVGRLDVNTQGLLLFTNDGDLANRLMHPSSQVEREYAVRVRGDLSDEQIARLKEGVPLEDGMGRFLDVQFVGGNEEGANRWYHVVIGEGRKREVRRMMESQDVTVSRLIRVRFGHLHLPRDLPHGRWKELEKDDIDQLSKAVGVPLKKRTGLYGRKKVRTDRQQEKISRRGYLRRRKG